MACTGEISIGIDTDVKIRLAETNLVCWSTGATDPTLCKNKNNITEC